MTVEATGELTGDDIAAVVDNIAAAFLGVGLQPVAATGGAPATASLPSALTLTR